MNTPEELRDLSELSNNINSMEGYHKTNISKILYTDKDSGKRYCFRQ